MRLALINSRLTLVGDRGAIDVAAVTAGEFPPNPRTVYDRWAEFTAWPSVRTCPSGWCGSATDPAVLPGQVLPRLLPHRAGAGHPDEFADPDNIEIGCTRSGQQMQKGRTDDLIFSVSQLIESLSEIIPLLPGDLIFTGTPAGIG